MKQLLKAKQPPSRIGTAGWSILRDAASSFPGEGSHLERYARRILCAEINSSFYRPPRTATWKRWADSVPDGFRFSVKAPRVITHDASLACSGAALADFLEGARLLGEKLGPLLFQLPPKLAFDATVAKDFFSFLRETYPGPAALEPRHGTWFTPEVSDLLASFSVARVAADPPRVPEAALPAGWHGLVYFRLHGSPRTYYSRYGTDFLRRLGASMEGQSTASYIGNTTPSARIAETWVIFDNTASGAAIHNALELLRIIDGKPWIDPPLPLSGA